ncbi:MAG TPA: nucleotidyltransferase domain-containing protein [Acidisarcina sp.]
MGVVLDSRRAYTDQRISALGEHLGLAEALCEGRACVYATGSFGRGEAHESSDLDVFIVGHGSKENRDLSRLDEIKIKAQLILATEEVNIERFDGDGKYLEHYTVRELTSTLGKADDDVSNTFTARLLLLLESKPLLAPPVYVAVIENVIDAYWIDYPQNKTDFTPAYLANDILRLWRTFCVNYEARTSREPASKNAERKLKNYKLKYSRLLTCYSGLLYLLALHVRNATVHRQDAMAMISLTPTQRLEWLLSQPDLSDAHDGVLALIRSYEHFLEVTRQPKLELLKIFSDAQDSKRHYVEASAFGDLVFEVIQKIGQGKKLHRLLLV